MNVRSSDGRFDHILLDDQSIELARPMIEQMQQGGVICDDPVLHVLDARTWLLTPDSLYSLFGDCDFNETRLMIRDHIAWKAMKQFVTDQSSETERDFMGLSTQDLAEEIATDIVNDDGIDIDECHMIIAHSNTMQLGGFIPLVRAIRERQELEGCNLVKVYVHDGTRSSLRLFEEVPMSVRQT